MKKTLITALVLIQFIAGGQTTDSLKSLLQQQNSIEKKATLCIKLSDDLLYKNLDSAKKYINRANTLAQKVNKPGLHAQALNLLGNYYVFTGRLDSAVIITQNARDLCLQNQIKDSSLSRIYNDLGYIELERNNAYKAMRIFKKSLEIDQQNKNYEGIASNYSNIAQTYFRLHQYEKASEFYSKAVDYMDRYNLKSKLNYIYSNVGQLFFRWGKYEEAEAYYKKSLSYNKQNNIKYDLMIDYNNLAGVYQETKRFEIAIEYYKKALEIAKAFNSLKDIALINNNIGRIYQKIKSYPTAMDYFQKARQQFEKTRLNNNLAAVYLNMSEISIAQQNYTKAEGHLAKALKLSKRNNLLEIQYNVMHYYHEISYERGQYKKSTDYLRKTNELRDSIFKQRTDEKLNTLHVKYQTAQKERKIAILNKEKAVQQAKLSRQRILIISVSGGLILVVLLIILIYSRYRIKSKLNQKLQTLNYKLTVSEANLKALNYTKDRFFSILAHDLKTPLVSFRNITEALSLNFRNITKEKAEHYITQAYQTAGKITDLLENLLQWSLVQTKHIGKNEIEFDAGKLIAETAEIYKNQMAEKHITLVNHVSENCNVIADKDMISTVMRNLLSNAVKFTPERGTITLTAEKKAEFYQFAVTDSGIGISQEDQEKLFRIDKKNKEIGNSPNKGTGLGLILCKEFIEENGGEIWVKSEEDTGTTFFFTIKRVN